MVLRRKTEPNKKQIQPKLLTLNFKIWEALIQDL